MWIFLHTKRGRHNDGLLYRLHGLLLRKMVTLFLHLQDYDSGYRYPLCDIRFFNSSISRFNLAAANSGVNTASCTRA